MAYFFYRKHSDRNDGPLPKRYEASPRRGAGVRSALRAVLLFCFIPLCVWAAPPHSPYNLALVEFQSGNFRQASTTLESALQQDPDSASVQLLLARCYYELKDWGQAVSYAESAKKIEPQDAEIHLWLGRIYGREAEQEHSLELAVKTRKEFEQAVSLDPSNVDAHRDLMTFYLEAPWVLGGGKAKALKQAEAIGTLDPVEGALARAHYYETLGQAPQAAAEFNKAVQLKPGKPGPYFEAANFYESRGDAAGMKTAVEAAAKVSPADPRLHYYRGAAEVMAGKQLVEAERELKSYLALPRRPAGYPSQASALSWLGQVYERSGRPQLAAEEYMAALQLDPQLGFARQGLQRLKAENSTQ